MSIPEINVQDIRSSVKFILESFDGLEVPSFDDDVTENFTLAVAIVTQMRRLMREEKNYSYIPTSVDFVSRVQIPPMQASLSQFPAVEAELVEEYVETIIPAIARTGIRIREAIPRYQDAHLILTMLYFALCVLCSHFPDELSREKIIGLLNAE